LLPCGIGRRAKRPPTLSRNTNEVLLRMRTDNSRGTTLLPVLRPDL
jgi:hypothetical protein